MKRGERDMTNMNIRKEEKETKKNKRGMRRTKASKKHYRGLRGKGYAYMRRIKRTKNERGVKNNIEK
ncbi:hypothetical protein SK128_022117, partial [Halocaridina rubra]